MKTSTALRMVIGLSVLALLASCSPSTSSNTSANGYQSSSADNSNIIGGELADSTYQQESGVVGVFDALSGSICTGSLIKRNLVLTAAHCVNAFSPKAMLVFFATDLSKVIGKTEDGRLVYDKTLARLASKTVRNAKYNSQSDSMTESTNDIALILLASDAPAEFKLANLPTADLVLKAGDEVTLSGYGLSEYKTDPATGRRLVAKGSGILRKVDGVKIVSILPSGEEITFDQSQGRGACHGDSGGPAFYTTPATETEEAKTYVIGATSRGPGDCNEIVVYSSTLGQAKWIADTSAALLSSVAAPVVAPTVAVPTAPTEDPADELPVVTSRILQPIVH